MTWVRTVLREPLLHFLVLGAGLFLLSGVVGDKAEEGPSEIVVSAAKIEHLAQLFQRTWRRPPTKAELDGLIEDHIQEEILYREALALGLDQDDTVIRRRLRQKMEFVAQDLARPGPAGDAELQVYLEAHPERFTLPGRLTFVQLFLDRERRGADLEADAARLLERLNARTPPVEAAALGDPSLLEPAYDDVSSTDVARLLGPDFAGRLDELPVGRWAGPVPSPYGWHLVRIDDRTPPRLPPLERVRAEVARGRGRARGQGARCARRQAARALRRRRRASEGRCGPGE